MWENSLWLRGKHIGLSCLNKRGSFTHGFESHPASSLCFSYTFIANFDVRKMGARQGLPIESFDVVVVVVVVV